MGRVHDSVRHVEHHRPLTHAGQVIARLGPLDDDQPVPVHLQQPVAAFLRGSRPAAPGHRAPDTAHLVPQVGSDDVGVVDEAVHDGLPVAYPVFLGLRYATQGSEDVVRPAGIAGVRAAAPGRRRDVIVHDDGDTGVCQGLDDGGEDVEGAQTEEIRIRGQVAVVDIRVRDDHLVRVGQPHAVEAEHPDAGGDDGAVLDLEPAGDKQLVAAAVPVDAGELEPAADAVDDITTLGSQRHGVRGYARLLDEGRQRALAEQLGAGVGNPWASESGLCLPHVADVAAYDEEGDEG